MYRDTKKYLRGKLTTRNDLEYFKLEQKNAKQWAVACYHTADRKKSKQINYSKRFYISSRNSATIPI